MEANAIITKEFITHIMVSLSGIGCFRGTFSLWVSDSAKTYNASPRHVEYIWHEHLEMS